MTTAVFVGIRKASGGTAKSANPNPTGRYMTAEAKTIPAKRRPTLW
jgi:hypothetical protein